MSSFWPRDVSVNIFDKCVISEFNIISTDIILPLDAVRQKIAHRIQYQGHRVRLAGC